MLRDNLVGLIEPMLSSAGANPLAQCTARKKPSDDRPSCLENPRPEGAESTLTENAASPFHAEPRHTVLYQWQDLSCHVFVPCWAVGIHQQHVLPFGQPQRPNEQVQQRSVEDMTSKGKQCEWQDKRQKNKNQSYLPEPPQ